MTAATRKALLTAHVVFSVGWLGAVVAFCALAVAARAGADPDSASFIALNTIGLVVIVPASLLSVATGIVQSLVTPWGLARHRWVVAKLVLGLAATALLLLHQFSAVAVAARRAASHVPVGLLATQLVIDALLAIAALLVITVISIYKPWGLTRYGQRQRDPASARPPLSRSSRIGLVVACVLFATIVVVHLLGGGLHHHG